MSYDRYHHHTHRSEGSFWTGFGLSTGCLFGIIFIVVGLPLLGCGGLLLMGFIGEQVAPPSNQPANTVNEWEDVSEPDPPTHDPQPRPSRPENITLTPINPAPDPDPVPARILEPDAIVSPPTGGTAVMAATKDVLDRYTAAKQRGDTKEVARIKSHNVAAEVTVALDVVVKSKGPKVCHVRPTAGPLSDRDWVVSAANVRLK